MASAFFERIKEKFEDLEWWFKDHYEKIRGYYDSAGFGFSFEIFAAGLFLLAVLVFLLLLFLQLPMLEAVIAFIAVITFIISIPITFRQNRIAAIEKNLPDVLKHMGLVLKAGGTSENALDEVADEESYGPLGADLRKAVYRMRRGQTFEDVLKQGAEESGSILLRRVVSIIVDAKKAGAGLADVLFAIAEDAKDLLQIQRERISRTTMHVIFIVASSMLIAPFIFGFVLSVINYIAVNMILALPGAKPMDICGLGTVFTAFLVIQACISTLMLGIIRYGRLMKYILYLPVVLLIVLIIFEGAKWMSNLIVGGAGIAC